MESRNNDSIETAQVTNAQEKWQCPDCETINTGSVCSVCGSPRNEPQPPPSMPVKKPSRVWNIALLLVAVGEAIILLINSPLFCNERTYRLACNEIESKNYELASDYIYTLNADGASQYYAALFRFAEAIVKDGKGEELSEYFAALKDMNKADAQLLAARYEKELYDSAVRKYRSGDYSYSKTVFEAIPEYERSKDYLSLIEMQGYRINSRQWWSGGYNENAKKCAEKLMDIVDFEDAGELLLSSTDSALLFLEGGWSNGAGTWISFSYAEEAADYDFLASWSIKGVPNGSWRFQDGEFLLTDAGGIESCKANFAVVDKNTITITTEVTGDTYTLKRQ